jgi:hypothetical protein
MWINVIAVNVLWTAFDNIMSTEHWSLHFLRVIVCSFNFREMLKLTLFIQFVGFRNQSPRYCEICLNIVEKLLQNHGTCLALLEHISYLGGHLHSSQNFQSFSDKKIMLYDEPVRRLIALYRGLCIHSNRWQ